MISITFLINFAGRLAGEVWGECPPDLAHDLLNEGVAVRTENYKVFAEIKKPINKKK